MNALSLVARVLIVSGGLATLAAVNPSTVTPSAAAGGLTAPQIVERNAVARGGVNAWRKIQTMAWAGHVESSAKPGHDLPFLLEQQRPAQTRFEVMAQNQRSVRIYDGTSGWKLHPGGSGAPVVEAYNADETNFARDAQVIDGPLMDDVARGATVSLTGVDSIDGRKAYALQSTLPGGAVHRIWVDAESFLEMRYEREFRNAVGRSGVASVRYRDYQAFQGLQIPTVIETVAADGKAANRLVVEKVALNPTLDARMFARPDAPAARHRGVVVDTRNPHSPVR